MVLPVIPDVYRCAVGYAVAGQGAVNVLHVTAPGDPSPVTVALAVAEAWGATDSLCSLQSTSVNLNTVEVTPLDGLTPTSGASFGAADNDNGTHSAFPMPAGDCLVLSLKSAERGRSKNGRLFISGLCSNQMDTNQQFWSGATQTAAEAAWGVFLTELNAAIGGAVPVIASYKLEEAFEVVSATARSSVCSQRRRDH